MAPTLEVVETNGCPILHINLRYLFRLFYYISQQCPSSCGRGRPILHEPLKIGRLRGNQLNEHGETRHRVICRNEKQRPGDEMSGYEDTLKDIEETFSIVPGFMKALPQEVLVHD